MESPTREQFVNEVIKVVGARFPLVKIARGIQQFSMRVNGHVASLENLYRMSVLRPEGTRRHVERWIVELLRAAEGTPDLEGTFEELSERILPLVMPENSDPNQLSVTQPLGGGLVGGYGIDKA